MEYFKIDNVDYSKYVSGLKVSRAANFSSQKNAAGNTIIDYINSKRTIEVSIIPLEDEAMRSLQKAIEDINVSITFRNPVDGELTTINAYLPSDNVDYYTIQTNKVMYKTFNLTFIEL